MRSNLLLLGQRDGAAAVLISNNVAALDEAAQLVVGGLIVAVEGLQPINLLLHLGELRELLLVGLFELGRLRFISVDLRLRSAALRLEEESDDEGTYLLLEHVRGVAVARRDGRAALEGLRQLRVHLDVQVPVLSHLMVAGGDALVHPLDEGLPDDSSADVDDPSTRQLRNLVLLTGHVEVHGLKLREEVEDLRHREVLVLRGGQVSDGRQ